MSKDLVCKTSRWQMLKAVLNNLDAASFQQKIEAGNTIIIDVRTLEEFEMNHLPNAKHINYFDDDFWEQIAALDKEKDILVYCRSGRRSIRVCTLMRNSSFDSQRIFNLNGGILEWIAADLAVEQP